MIDIVYYTGHSTGRMQIDVKEFVTCHGLPKIKKLIKVIQQSTTPEKVQAITEFCSEFSDGWEDEMKHLQEIQKLEEGQVARFERLVKECTVIRDRYKKRSEGWLHHQQNLEKFRKELSHHRTKMRDAKNGISAGNRLKEKCEKVIEYIDQR